MVVVGGVVGGEPGVLIVVGSKVRTLPVEAGGGLKTFTRPEEHQRQTGEDQLHGEVHTDASCGGSSAPQVTHEDQHIGPTAPWGHSVGSELG